MGNVAAEIGPGPLARPARIIDDKVISERSQ
jgi:hypothetical protein